MIDKRILSALSLGRKAGAVTAGFDAVKKVSGKKKAQRILLTGDASDRTARGAERIGDDHAVQVISMQITGDDIKQIFGKRFVILAVTDLQIAHLIDRALGNEE